jgi:hypothetical protein
VAGPGWNCADFENFAAAATVDDWTTFDQVVTYFEITGVLYERAHASIELLDDLFAGKPPTSLRSPCSPSRPRAITSGSVRS